jgi:hypothetical protein
LIRSALAGLVGAGFPVIPLLNSAFGHAVAVSGDPFAIGSNTRIQLYEKRRHS